MFSYFSHCYTDYEYYRQLLSTKRPCLQDSVSKASINLIVPLIGSVDNYVPL